MTKDQTTYRVTGMTCGGCSSSMSSAIERAAPGLRTTVSHADDTVVIHGKHDPEIIKAAVTDAGFDFGGEVS
ncbi:MAG: copper chaperone [Myxococcota bacterium]|jgi:copper chaperone